VPDVASSIPKAAAKAIAACIDKKVHAISTLPVRPDPGDGRIRQAQCPYLQGNTQRNATIA